MREWGHLFKEAANSLKRKPSYVGAIALTMGLSIGALLCVLALAYLVWVEPLPYPEQNRLYKVAHITGDPQGSHSADWFTYPGLIHLYKHQDVFSSTALLDYEQAVITSQLDQPTRYVTYTTPEIFSLLGINMHLGRGFESTEALNTHNPVAILSYQTWQNDFNSSDDILSQKVTIKGVSFQVIGVLSEALIEPQLFRTGRQTGVWLPWDFNARKQFENLWFGISELAFVGRLKPNMLVSTAEQALTPLVNDTWQQNVSNMPFFDGWSTDIKLNSFKRVITGDSSSTITLALLGVLGLVVIASTNISNLFISRTAQNSYTFSIRAALGAKSRTLYKHLFAESFLLIGIAVLFGLAVATIGFALLKQHFGELIPRSNELALGSVTLMFAILLAWVLAAFFAFLSYQMLNINSLNDSLRNSGKGISAQVSKKVRQTLIGTQISIAMILIFVTAHLVHRSLLHIGQANDLDIQQSIHLVLTQKNADTASAADSAMREFKKALLNHPAITSVTQSESTLSRLGNWAITNLSNSQRYVVSSRSIAPNYFEFHEHGLIDGRLFNQEDIENNHSVILVNKAFATKLTAGETPIGMRFSAEGKPSMRVVGVVENVRLPGELTVPPTAYSLLLDNALEFTVKTLPGFNLNRSDIIKLLESSNSQYTLFNFEPLKVAKGRLLFSQYTTAIMALLLALLTLFLAGVGLYGIFSYSTQVRRFEIGTRIALGAKGKSIIRLVFKDNVSVILIGMSIGATVLITAYFNIGNNITDTLSGTLIPLSVATILSILSLSLWACYWPLRKYINNPAIHSLRRAD